MLVSVIVITYKSSKYVIDTLESIKAQTYGDIELIISDDCSPDNTFEICKDWLSNNSGKFASVLLTRTPKNGGICVNYNNGLKHAHGEWIKYIAGDDILTPNCIEEFVNATKLVDGKIMICGTLPFQNNGSECAPRLLDLKYFAGDAASQERLLVRKGTIIEGPTLFLHRETLENMGGFDEKYPFIEDYPLYMKYLQHGYRVHLVPKHLVRYREYPQSVSRSDNRFSTSIFDAIEDYAIPAAWRNRMYLYWYHEKVRKAIRHKSFPRPILYILSGLDLINIYNKFKRWLTRIDIK